MRLAIFSANGACKYVVFFSSYLQQHIGFCLLCHPMSLLFLRGWWEAQDLNTSILRILITCESQHFQKKTIFSKPILNIGLTFFPSTSKRYSKNYRGTPATNKEQPTKNTPTPFQVSTASRPFSCCSLNLFPCFFFVLFGHPHPKLPTIVHPLAAEQHLLTWRSWIQQPRRKAPVLGQTKYPIGWNGHPFSSNIWNSEKKMGHWKLKCIWYVLYIDVNR